MTPLLLDTHLLVWLMGGNSRITPSLRAGLEKAAAEADLLVSAITPWEIAMLSAKGRLRLNRDVGEWIDAALQLPGIKLAPLLPAIAVESNRLPWEVHPDPADRILLATARHLDVALVTADKRLLEYSAMGFVQCVAC